MYMAHCWLKKDLFNLGSIEEPICRDLSTEDKTAYHKHVDVVFILAVTALFI